jgi:hypothetical protein
MRLICALFCSTLFLTGSWAQETEKQKNPFSFIPYGLRLGIDVMDLGLSAANEDIERYGINADIDIYKFLIQFDAGSANRTRIGENVEYRSRGLYYRIGLDYNFMYFDDDKSTIFIGLRYARSPSYEDEMKLTVTDSIYGTRLIESGNNSASAEWGEANLGIKAKIWRNFYMGFISRFKFRLNRNASGSLNTFDVPGFGRTDESTIVAFNYYIWYRIPFRKNDMFRPKKRN